MGEIDWDTLWGMIEVLPEIIEPDSTKSVVDWYKRSRRDG